MVKNTIKSNRRKNMPKITKCLELSTAHITESTANLIKKEPNKNNLTLSVFPLSVFGYLINVTPTFNTAIPKDLNDCINLAKENNCEWIMFDSDIDPIDDLPKYEW